MRSRLRARSPSRLPLWSLTTGISAGCVRSEFCPDAQEESMTNVLDSYMVDSEVSFLDKAKIQAQVLVPVVRALREELGKDKADALVKQALSGWSRQLFAEIGQDIEGGGRRRWAKMQGALNDISKAGV